MKFYKDALNHYLAWSGKAGDYWYFWANSDFPDETRGEGWHQFGYGGLPSPGYRQVCPFEILVMTGTEGP